MRETPDIPVGIEDPKLNRFLTRVQICLTSVLDLTIYESTVIWKPPFSLFIPTGTGKARTVQPKVIELGRAVIVNQPTTPVYYGATTWEWKSNDQVSIIDQAGLVEGVKYQLTYKVIG